MNHIDLLVVNGDFVLDYAGFAEPISERASIGQDIKHRIIESGLLKILVAERSPINQERIINQVIIEVEKDSRLVPGTVHMAPLSTAPGTYYLTAKTLEYGDLQVNLS